MDTTRMHLGPDEGTSRRSASVSTGNHTTKARCARRGQSCRKISVNIGEVRRCLLDDGNIGGGGRRSPKKKLQVFYNYATILLHFYDFAPLVPYLVVRR